MKLHILRFTIYMRILNISDEELGGHKVQKSDNMIRLLLYFSHLRIFLKIYENLIYETECLGLFGNISSTKTFEHFGLQFWGPQDCKKKVINGF